MPSTVTGRLTAHPLAAQIRSVRRTQQSEVQKVVDWFLFWEQAENKDRFIREFEGLDDEQKGEFRRLQGIFEAVVERAFSLINDPVVRITPMIEAFTAMREFVRCVARKHAHGLMLVGPGGIGKSYTVIETVRQEGLVENQHFVRIPGYATPVGLYNALFENKEKLVIFDDCDSIFKDLTALNILKAVMDTLPERKVAWKTSSNKVMADSFQFDGQIIFISNMDPNINADPNFRALLTRTMTLLVSASRQEILMRMVQLIPAMAPDLRADEREDVIKYLYDNQQHFKDFSLRFLKNLISLRKYDATNWKNLASSLN